ncbi:MAG: retroviral-like aspartic protease family protein [Chitinophagales bacterium]|nr:retroviral-like aspartic protease family protein [Chitinophagales bacterium]MDW8428457.1 retropepsin-like aspartic protease [Chitinophagales bacterium]
MGKKVRIPLEICSLADEGHHFFVNASVNGQSARLLVDTGASRSVFSHSWLKERFPELTIEESQGVATGAGTSQLPAGIAWLQQFHLGDLSFTDFPVAVLEMQHVNDAYRQAGLPPIDGVLGCDLLVQLQAVINVRRKTLRLRKPRKRS